MKLKLIFLNFDQNSNDELALVLVYFKVRSCYGSRKFRISNKYYLMIIIMFI